MSAADEDEMTLLGLAVYQSQRLEFALYGLAAHLSHLPEAAKEKRFRELTPGKFLRGDYSELKSTLGQIVKVFGAPLLLDSRELDELIEDRNLICHNLFRLYHANGPRASERPHEFLYDFNRRAERWSHIIAGLYSEMLEAFAEKENRLSEFKLTDQNIADRATYHAYVQASWKAKLDTAASPAENDGTLTSKKK